MIKYLMLLPCSYLTISFSSTVATLSHLSHLQRILGFHPHSINKTQVTLLHIISYWYSSLSHANLSVGVPFAGDPPSSRGGYMANQHLGRSWRRRGRQSTAVNSTIRQAPIFGTNIWRPLWGPGKTLPAATYPTLDIAQKMRLNTTRKAYWSGCSRRTKIQGRIIHYYSFLE